MPEDIERKPGTILLLNGPPRAGKSSIAKVVQDTFPGVWINLGVDVYMKAIPEKYQPGIGLRPGGEKPEMEPLIVSMYEALYSAMAVHSRLGLNIVADVGHHDDYSVPLGILPHCAALLHGLPVLFVGVLCPLDAVMERRIATWGQQYEAGGVVPAPIQRWHKAVHEGHIYDLELDTSIHTPEACAAMIFERLTNGKPGTAMSIHAKSKA